MKKILCILMLLALALTLSSCGKKAFVPNYEKAVGMILVNGSVTAEGKVYAKETERGSVFDGLDAAQVHYYDVSDEEAVAGDQNLFSLQFSANAEDGKSVGAKGVAAYRYDPEGENKVTAYYLYYDGTGLYFDPLQPVRTETVTDGLEIRGEDYRCSILFRFMEPADHFTLTWLDKDGKTLQEVSGKPRDYADYLKLEAPEGAEKLTAAEYRADGTELGRSEITKEMYSYTVCFENGGQILPSRYLRIVWPQ